ncbi:MAG TPA: hypothetical protein VK019_01580 [Pseudomonas sp.]|nr:hypothetical protein [Pseudomonas sp.]
MHARTLALLGLSLLLTACAGQPTSAEQALARYGAKAQFTPFRPLQPDFRDAVADDYRLIPMRRYQGRGQISHYGWGPAASE